MSDVTISAGAVKELREKTGVGMMACKSALVEAGGDVEKASEILREKGLAAAVKKSGRIAAEGIVESYIHLGGKIGVLIEVNCETDFVAKTDQFKSFVRDIAMHVAAANPKYVNVEDVDPADVEKEKTILMAQALNEGKPANIAEKMVEGRLRKFYETICLSEQAFVKDPDKKVKDVVTEMVATIGENIAIRRFTRYEMGEGLEKKVDNFVEEVMAEQQK
ncbi:MAG: translation elongation factor Ts [Christensenellaceae bacterium]|jgi:elongation factor Ts